MERSPAIESPSRKERKYVRHKAPKGMFIAWKSANQRTVSRAETIGMGGLFLHTRNPPAVGSVIEMVFEVKNGKVRVRATVRYTAAGKGMGVQFMQMWPEDRAKLNQFLKLHQPETEETKTPRSASTPSSPKFIPVPPEPTPKTANPVSFETELRRLLEIAENGTYYQLLSVTPESTGSQVKQSFYALARKFHPDHNMDKEDTQAPLKHLMEVVTLAYKTLGDKEKRAIYDKQLAAAGAFHLHRGKTESQKTLEECHVHAMECLRAKNFLGSIVWLRKCTEIAPQDPNYHALLARSLGTVPDYVEEAIAHFKQAIELDPWKLPVYFLFAELYEGIDHPAEAREVYLKILEINPGHPKALEKISLFDSDEKDSTSSPLISRLFTKKG